VIANSESTPAIHHIAARFSRVIVHASSSEPDQVLRRLTPNDDNQRRIWKMA